MTGQQKFISRGNTPASAELQSVPLATIKILHRQESIQKTTQFQEIPAFVGMMKPLSLNDGTFVQE
jgi:hypothetical protein